MRLRLAPGSMPDSLRPVLVAGCVATTVAAGASQAIPDIAGAEITSWLFLGLAVLGLVERGERAPAGLRWPTMIEWMAALLLAAGFFSSLMNGGPAWLGAIRMAQHVTILVAIAGLAPTWPSFRAIARGLLLGMMVQVVIGLVELVRGATFFYSLWKPLDASTWQGLSRIASTPADPNYFALGLVACLPLAWNIRALWPSLPGWASVIAVAAWLTAIAFTFSRAGYLALGAIAVLWLMDPRVLHRDRHRSLTRWLRLHKYASAAGVALLVTLLFFTRDLVAAFASRLGSISAGTGDSSLSVRIAAQHAAALAFVRNPIAGLGLDQFVTKGPRYLAEVSGIARTEINVLDSFLLTAAEAGIVGFVAYTGATLATLHAFFRGERLLSEGSQSSSPPATRILWALFLGMIGWILMSFTLDSIHSPIQWTLFGLAALATRWLAGRNQEAAPHVR